MASVTHLKGVRTRFRNIIEKNVQICANLSQRDIEIESVDASIAETNKCIQNLQVHNEKLEKKSDKLATALEDTDPEFVLQITNDDSTLCALAVECCIDLQLLKEKFVCYKGKQQTKVFNSEKKEQLHTEELVQLQRNMQKFMEMQIEQQERFMESQKQKDKVSSIKLPKLDLISFCGDKTKWIEFWDLFKCSVHENRRLSNSEKFNYLKSKVYGEAQRAISGLTLSDANYDIAIYILTKRFGNVQETVDLHYSKLINLTHATNKTDSLRNLLDTVERHIRSLEVLEQNVNQDVFVSMVRTKIPENVLV
ncbi:uncharacterized protein LOC128546434 [Mercenaria mercenaria]|uniref:uncharacterized protein LOC128546434 n=1 Tax=Mercenaria mercenaria TaxID=6596 RepID=UPI00234F37F6|nr:uncharacterized protein LOC128546434 [Mercenaria mercenaria]